MRWILALFVLLLSAPSWAGSVEGRAYAVDGRTIAVLTPGKTVYVRLNGIRVPQGQKAEAKAWQTLGRMVLPEIVSCEIPEGAAEPLADHGVLHGICRIGQFDLSRSMVHLRVAEGLPAR